MEEGENRLKEANMTIEERIERVEKQNRRLKWAMTATSVVVAAVLVGVIVAVVFAVRQPAPPTALAVADVIQAKEFQVVDDVGSAVVTLRSWKLGGRIETRNHQGKRLFSVAAADDGSGTLSTYNAEGKELVSLGSTDEGHGALSTRSAEGKELVSLTAMEGGSGGALTTYNAEGKELVSLGMTEGGSGMVTTHNAEGKELVSLGMAEGGSGTVTTHNAEGKELVSLAVVDAEGVMDGTGMVGVYDPTGRTRRGILTTRP